MKNTRQVNGFRLALIFPLIVALFIAGRYAEATVLNSQTQRASSPPFCEQERTPISLGIGYFPGCNAEERLLFAGETLVCKKSVPSDLGKVELVENVFLSTIDTCGDVDVNMAANFRELCEASLGDFAMREPFRSVFLNYEPPVSCIDGPIEKRAQLGTYHSIRHVNHQLRPLSPNTTDADVYVLSRPSTSTWWFQDAAGNEFPVLEKRLF